MQRFEIKLENIDFNSQESFKTLRFNVEFSGERNQVFYVTSTFPNEGKSTVSLELSLSFAENGKKVLLIDADLRKSVSKRWVHKGDITMGLTDYLVGRGEISDVLAVSDIPNFSMIFSGPTPPNPSEILSGRRFEQLIETVKRDFDIIIIDTPPMLSVIDAAVIAKSCDGGIIVISSGKTSYRQIRKTRDQLERANSKIIGCVLNKVDNSQSDYYSYYYK